MVVQCEAKRIHRKTVYRLHCCECHEYVGDIDKDELQHLMTGKYGRVVCWRCEDRWIQLFGFSPNDEGSIVQ